VYIAVILPVILEYNMPDHVTLISQEGTGSSQPDSGIHGAAWKRLQGAGRGLIKAFAAFKAEERERED